MTHAAMRLLSGALFATALLPFAAIPPVTAETLPGGAVAHADYGDPALWLCRPGLAVDYCRSDIDATVIAADGSTRIERYEPAKDAPIDCFFVYPTVSRDPGWQSDFVPGQEEIDDVRQQFARFGKVCRQFAPMYRQNTLTALRRNAGGPQPVGEQLPDDVGRLSDVRDAWNWYMRHKNRGRGVVLIGHSQGAAMVAQLIAQDIEGKPVQRQLVSALVIGGPVYVPDGKDVGGTFKSVPLCRAAEQTGCVISYATFRDTNPPPAGSRFGRATDGLRYACTNPANLAGGSGSSEAYFRTKGFLNDAGGTAPFDWTTPPRPITTFFVKTPGLVSTRCVRSGEFDYLALHVNPTPGGQRTNTIRGEIVRPSGIDYSWGLHILDTDHAMGNLIAIVERQGQAYRGQRPDR